MGVAVLGPRYQSVGGRFQRGRGRGNATGSARSAAPVLFGGHGRNSSRRAPPMARSAISMILPDASTRARSIKRLIETLARARRVLTVWSRTGRV